MKLSMDGFIVNSCSTVKKLENSYENGGVHMNADKKFDEVIMTSSQKDIQEKIFTERLGNKMKTEAASQQNSDEKLNFLKEAIANGKYKLDSMTIASKILFSAEVQNG